MANALIHLVCGSTGAGKTPYATALCERLCGVRFSIDEWMAALFWPDAPEPIDGRWAMERVERCNGQIWSVARQIAARGLPCVLDLGFTTRASRTRVADLAREAGFAVQLHWVDVPPDERWRRVERRNTDGSGRLDFAVTREMFDYVERMWEPPTSDEMAGCDGVSVPGAG